VKKIAEICGQVFKSFPPLRLEIFEERFLTPMHRGFEMTIFNFRFFNSKFRVFFVKIRAVPASGGVIRGQKKKKSLFRVLCLFSGFGVFGGKWFLIPGSKFILH